MRYKNNRTEAIVDSPFKVFGDDWELVEKEVAKEKEEQEETEQEETEQEETEEIVEEEVDLSELTNKKLEELAKEQGIELTTEDKKNKDTRIAAIVAALE